jgi:hypothetical protein
MNHYVKLERNDEPDVKMDVDKDIFIYLRQASIT